MTTATAPTPVAAAKIASEAVRYMAVPAQLTFEYGLMLAKDIPAEKFAHMPHPSMNHAAFNYGHLAIYPNRILMLLGRNDLIVDNPRFTELLGERGVLVWEADGRVRYSAHLYNDSEDVERAIEASRYAVATLGA